VRLHTVRALAKARYQAQLPSIARRLTDPNWMVREAAVRVLLGFDAVGANQLYDHFLASQDRYSREQIVDEWQRAGFIPALVQQYGRAANGRESQVIQHLVQMGKTSYLLASVEGAGDNNLRRKFLEDFGRQPDEQIRAWVAYLATYEADPDLRALAQAARRAGRA
jgi:HEAT repeat protein